MELKAIADRLFREIRCSEPPLPDRYIIESKTLDRILELVDRLAKKKERCRKCDHMASTIESIETRLQTEIEKLEEQLGEYKSLPKLIV